MCKTEGYEYLIDLLDFLLIEYVRIFGEDTLYAEKCLIYNDPEAECPMLIINAIPIQIRLAQSSLNYWAQTIFQLSHELCHYCIRQRKDNKNYTLSWFEEIVCEAISLYFLKWAADNWNKCRCQPLVFSRRHGGFNIYSSPLLYKRNIRKHRCTV